MPFKSIAERERLRTLTAAGQFPQADFDRLVRESEHVALPDRVTPAPPVTRLSTGGSSRYTPTPSMKRTTLY